MPDQEVIEPQTPTQAAPTATVPEPDPYELGDTSLFPQEPAPTQTPVAQQPPAATQQPYAPPEPEQPADNRPRNSDGTFKKIHSHSAAVVDAAREFGLSDEEIGDTAPATLHRIIITQLKARNDYRDRVAAEKTLQQSEVRTPQPEQRRREPEPAATEPEDELKELLHPTLYKRLTAAEKENQALKAKFAEIEELKTIVKKGREATVNDVIDSAFDDLSRPDVFGSGGINDLVNGSDEVMFRQSVLNAAGVVDGDTPASIKRKVTAAAKRFTAKIQPPQQEQRQTPPNHPIQAKPTISGYAPAPSSPSNGTNGAARPTREEWERDGPLHKPTARAAEELPYGTDRAVRNLQKKFGMDQPQARDSEELDGFLPQ